MRREVRIGLSYGVSRVAYDCLLLPADIRDATLNELIPFLPNELKHMPRWALQSILSSNNLIGLSAGGVALVTSVIFLTSTSGSNQTWGVLADWNVANNRVDCVSHGGNGGAGDTFNPETNEEDNPQGGGGGGGGFARRANLNLTPSGSATFHLEAGGVGTNTTEATWLGGSSLALSSVGIRGASNGSNAAGGAGGGGNGASTTNAVGDTTRAGGNGASGDSDGGNGGAGGGAAGPTGVGGNASGVTGGTGDGGVTPANTAGTQYTSDPGGVQAGPAGGTNATGASVGANGKLYGGGAVGGVGSGNAGGTGGQALIVITNNP